MAEERDKALGYFENDVHWSATPASARRACSWQPAQPRQAADWQHPPRRRTSRGAAPEQRWQRAGKDHQVETEATPPDILGVKVEPLSHW